MRKRDSIEFLWDEFKPFLPANYTVDESVKILSILKQAKAMHKEEVKNSYISGYLDNGYYEGAEEDASKLWEETYESNT